MNEEKLIKEFKKGNKEALKFIYEKYKRSLLKLIWYYVNNKEDAEDILQTVFYKVIKNIEKFSLKKGASFKTWVFRIAINSCKDFLKKKRSISLNDIEITAVSNIEKVEDKILIEKILNALNKIDLKYREVIMMIYLENMKYEEVADILNKPVGTIKSRLNYGINLLKNILGEKNE